jgi:flagellar basal-body rod protein FlgB
MERSVEMIGSNAFNYINVLDKAADASWKRNEVIANNIANVDTPGYKRKDVQFESYLTSALLGDNSLDKRVADANLDSLDATVYTDSASLSYRLDGNNVDIDTESANLAENQIRYYTLLDSMTQEFSRLKSVLTAR